MRHVGSDEKTVLLNVKEVAQLLTVGVRSVWRLDQKKKMPAARRIGHAKRWDAEELKVWLRLGCPDRDAFEKLRKG